MKRILGGCLLLGLVGQVFAQSQLNGPKQYPELRTMSGLPGGLFGLDFNGVPTFSGAMAISTPVGASLGQSQYELGTSDTSANTSDFSWFSNPGQHVSHGVAVGMMGVTFRHVGYLTAGDEILSRNLDHVVNFQFSPMLKTPNLGVALGVQNAYDHWAAAGTNLPGDQASSRSYYGVVTYRYLPGSYVSIGHGDQRFSGVFGNASYQIGNRAKLLTEYDGFNFNSGVAFNVADWDWSTIDHDAQVTLFLGVIREKYPMWAVTVTF